MKISKELSKGSTALLILGVLRRGDLYGYQIIKTVETLSDSTFQMNEGTLYPILHALEQEKFLESYWNEGEDTGRRRKYYHITQAGIDEFERQSKEFSTFEQAVKKVIGGALSGTV